jgi:hypothetical protein
MISNCEIGKVRSGHIKGDRDRSPLVFRMSTRVRNSHPRMQSGSRDCPGEARVVDLAGDMPNGSVSSSAVTRNPVIRSLSAPLLEADGDVLDIPK